VSLWDLQTRQRLIKFEEQDHGIDCVCFSSDDRFLVACGDVIDNRMLVYDTDTQLIIAWAQLCPKPAICMVAGGFVKDIKRRDTHEYLFAACGGKVITFWHLDHAKGEFVAHKVGNAGKESRDFACLAFTLDNEYLFAGTTSGDVGIILMKNRVVQSFVPVCSAGAVTIVALPAPEGAVRLLVGGGDGTVTILGGPNPTQLREEKQVRLDGPVTSLSLAPDCGEFMAVTSVGTACLIRSKDLAIKLHSQVSTGVVFDVAYPKGNSHHFVTCCGDGLFTLWDANDYSARLRCPVRTRAHPMACAATDDIMIAGCSDGRLMSFDCSDGRNLWHIDDAHKDGVTSVKIASNVRFLISGGADGALRVWEMKSRDMVSHLKEHLARITDVQLFPNDLYAISTSRDRMLLTWDLRSEKRLTQHRENHGGINCLAVASNQTTVYTAGQEKTLCTWDLRMPEATQVIDVDEELHTISLSPDDRYLATAGTGLVVKIWDITAGKVISEGHGHSRAVQKVAFSPDGKQLVSTGPDHAIFLWNIYTDLVGR
jgi:WD40 repeat protein